MPYRKSWTVDRLAQLQRDIELVLGDYISRCYEASDFAPEPWRSYWMAEAEHAHRLKQSMLHRTQCMIEHAAGRRAETLNNNADTI